MPANVELAGLVISKAPVTSPAIDVMVFTLDSDALVIDVKIGIVTKLFFKEQYMVVIYYQMLL